jgi:hypothetical protein
MHPLDLVLLALATWRLAALLAQEEGPFNLLGRLRHRLGVRYDAHSVPYADNELGKLLLCPWCSSVWLGAALAVAYFFWPAVAWLALPLALSAVACIVQEAVN